MGDVGGFWTKEKDLKNERLEFKPLFKKNNIASKEFNSNFEFLLNKKDLKFNNKSKTDNNDGYVLFNGELEKMQKHNFSKIRNFKSLEPSIIFYNDDLIFFDNSGSILSFGNNGKLNWKINDYSKNEKKIGPLISMIENRGQLYISDDLSKFYKIDIGERKIICSKKNELPFNSKIKFYNDKIYVVDSNNNLNCFSANDGKFLWKHQTEKSFINSSKKLSILVKDQLVIFSNSLGDITALNVKNGSLVWQKFTQNSKIYEDIMTLKTSNLIEDDGSIYFSNNKNQFYSIDLDTGITNWIQNINSNIKPAVIGKFIFTISDKFVVTLGSKGAICFDDGNLYTTQGLKVSAKDFTGAGDMFLGAFMHKFDGANSQEALNFANFCASKIIQIYGAKLNNSNNYQELLNNFKSM